MLEFLDFIGGEAPKVGLFDAFGDGVHRMGEFFAVFRFAGAFIVGSEDVEAIEEQSIENPEVFKRSPK